MNELVSLALFIRKSAEEIKNKHTPQKPFRQTHRKKAIEKKIVIDYERITNSQSTEIHQFSCQVGCYASVCNFVLTESMHFYFRAA